MFAFELPALGIPPEQALLSMDLTLPAQPIFVVGIHHYEIPRKGHVVGRDNHEGEGYFPPSKVVRSPS
jgi:hypothetical protein